MEHLCVRCARLALQSSSRSSRVGVGQGVRRFSSSASAHDDGPSKSSSATSASSRPSPQTSVPRSRFGQFVDQAVASGSKNPPPGAQLLRRTSPPRSSQSGPPRPPPPGQLLRRTAPPRSGGRAPAGSSPRPSGLAGRGAQRPPQPRRDRRLRRADARAAAEAEDEGEEDDPDFEAAVDKYINNNIDPPLNPTEAIPYTPHRTTVDELRADWPNTPLSPTGLTESVQQRIEWLARRLPHGYVTPGQLAERYHKGEFVRFESEEEKQKVLEIAADLAKQRAAKLTERKGQEVPAEDMAFEDVSSRSKDRNILADTYVKGTYPPLEKQKMPFLDTIVRNLRNNETYHGAETEKFIETIQGLIPAQAGRGSRQVPRRA